MSSAWWGKEATNGSGPPERSLVGGDFGPKPQLLPAAAQHTIDAIMARRPAYTPSWQPDGRDAGMALVDLFASQMSIIRKRLNRLPEKAQVEFLQAVGVEPAPAAPALAIAQFTVANTAPAPTLIPRGFQVGARPAEGGGELVVFETQDSISATSAKVEVLFVEEKSVLQDVTGANGDAEKAFFAFGDRPRVGNALVVGLGNNTIPAPSPMLALGIGVAAAPGLPPPVAAGGLATTPRAPMPLLRWAALVGGEFVPVEVIEDETGLLWRSGVIRLRVPPNWRAEPLAGGDQPRYWLRLRLLLGRFESPPQLSFVGVNMVRVKAVRTIRDEVLEPVEGDILRGLTADIQPGQPSQLKLRQTPVVPRSLVLEVDTDSLDDTDQEASRWEERPELRSAGPNERVYTLDPVSGVVTFGDGVHGATLPPGFRHVRAVRYETGGGRGGAVVAGEINALLNSAAFVTEVTNPLPASGGRDEQSQGDTIAHGPTLLRSRGRAVTSSDYARMALAAEGAVVARSHALPGYHPQYRVEIPGVVGVFILPDRDQGPPTPTEAELAAVARHLQQRAAPVGVQVVVAGVPFRRIRTRVTVQVHVSADVGDVAQTVIRVLDDYLHPLHGGAGGRGWRFGGTLVFSELSERLLTVEGVRAIPQLRLLVDGAVQPLCSDVPIRPDELFWPERHEVFPAESEVTG